MKTILSLCLIATLATALAETPPAAATDPLKRIVLANVDNAVNPAVMERVSTAVEEELSLPVEVRALTLDPQETLNDFVDPLSAAKGVHDACIVAFVAPSTPQSMHYEIQPPQALAVINAPVFLCDDDEKYFRRLKRITMRNLGFIFGLSPAPDPHCVTRDYLDLNDFDQMGTNFTPPWLDRFQRESAQRGLQALEYSAPEMVPAPEAPAPAQ